MTAAYERLADLAGRASHLAAEGRFDELSCVLEETAALREALPATPSPAVERSLRIAAAAMAETEAAVASAMRVLAADASRLEAGRTAVRGYRATAGSSSAVGDR
ncbi:MAG: hypothetical protein LT070_07925 [Solirubrobacteraceae bacterium]|nr:hypothetical protein [Solirubrobacteraceae bacterium]